MKTARKSCSLLILLTWSMTIYPIPAYPAQTQDTSMLSPQVFINQNTILSTFQSNLLQPQTFSLKDVQSLVDYFFIPNAESDDLNTLVDVHNYSRDIVPLWLSQITNKQMLTAAKRRIRLFRETTRKNFLLDDPSAFDPQFYTDLIDAIENANSSLSAGTLIRILEKSYFDLLNLAHKLGVSEQVDNNLMEMMLISLYGDRHGSGYPHEIVTEGITKLLEKMDISYKDAIRLALKEIENFEAKELVSTLLAANSYLPENSHYTQSDDWRKNPFIVLNRPEGRAAVLEWLSLYPGKELEDKSQIKEFSEFLSNPENHLYDSFTSPFLIETLMDRFPFLKELGQHYQDSLKEYLPKNDGDPTEHIAAVQRVKLLKPYLRGPNLLDIGSLTNHIAKRMVEQTPEIQKAIGVDITKRADLAPDTDYLTFRLMKNPAKLPVEDNFADSATLIYVLHHVEGNIQEYLKEVKRTLSPGGRLLVLEDTFSNTLPASFFKDGSAVKNRSLQQSYDKLTNDEKLAFLFFADWFSHYFIKTSRGTAVPGNYRSMEDWKELFKKAGFKIVKERYLGFSIIGSRNPVSRGLFVLEKQADANTSRKATRATILPGTVNESIIQAINISI